MRLFHAFSTTWPRPCIVEMGGKSHTLSEAGLVRVSRPTP
jgi:hypothetical protein